MGDSFHRGDRVLHPRCPQWGGGVVREAAAITHEGKPAQRLAVDFANRGRVVINTAVAPLVSHEEKVESVTMRSSSPSRVGGGWLTELEQATNNRSHELWDLPEALTDPFASASARLEATLQSYRYTTEARSLIDWAVVQTGEDDPLSKYTRSELEQAFPRFARNRDQHLQALVSQIKRGSNPQLLREAQQSTREPAARAALNKAIGRG